MNSLNKKINLLVVVLFFAFNLNAQDHVGDFAASGSITAEAGTYYFGSSDKRIGNFNLSAITYVSDHANNGGFRMMTNEQELLGSLSGQNNTFGLKDNSGNWFLLNSSELGYTEIKSNNNTAMRLYDSGKVRIGNVDTETLHDYKLYVEDGILSESLRVAVDGEDDWADYVFEDEFELMPLNDVKDYIVKNNHLPNVPSAEEMVLKGLDVLESDAVLLRKIEEAYLYIIEQQEKLLSQQNQLDKLNKEVENLKMRNNEQ